MKYYLKISNFARGFFIKSKAIFSLEYYMQII